ncbi:metal ion binding [Ascochyta rabiei]|uniref:Metal ion binding n=1 Tax=Didymella rabiei TaxID=5454 RepID=A0A163DS36_DIDRA|nr:metal ion binding [Ascochyta rabiei]
MNPNYIPILPADQAGYDTIPSTEIGAENNIDPSYCNSLRGPPENVDQISTGTRSLNNLDDPLIYLPRNTMEEYNASTWFNPSLWTNMYTSDTSKSLFNSAYDESTIPNRLALPYNAYETNNPSNGCYYKLHGQTSNQPVSTHYTPDPCHNTSSTPYNIPPLYTNLHRLVTEFYLPDDSAKIEDSPPSPVPNEAATTTIGSVLSNGKFTCNNSKCSDLSFARQAELRRHHATLHAPHKPEFWCQVPACPRSMEAGNRPFHRKDKLAAHTRSMHSGA